MSLSQPAHADRTILDRSSVRLALLGCGTVGSGVATLLLGSADAIAARSGVPFSLEAIAVRTAGKARGAVIPADLLREDAAAIVADPTIDVVIECVGGTGIAARYVEEALRRGKHVVTANKDLLATRGPELRALASAHGVTIAYEAAVGGAIPIVRTIEESLAGEEILEVGGVLNGTTNFVLSQMFAGASYAGALAEAQRLGFAEADPTNDVEGIDAAHKLAILAQLAFRRPLVTSQITRTGIDPITREDVSLARRLGLTIKLIGCARASESVVTPAYVHTDHPFARVNGPQNCIRVVGRSSGSLSFAGTGAGSAPTASAVIGDIVAVLRRIMAARTMGPPAVDDGIVGGALRAAAPGIERAIALRQVLRLASFRDARPAREALRDAGIEVDLLDGVPALATVGPVRESWEHFVNVLAPIGIVPESLIPLWDDALAGIAAPGI